MLKLVTHTNKKIIPPQETDQPHRMSLPLSTKEKLVFNEKSPSPFNPTSKSTFKKLIIALVIESTIALTIYYNYDYLNLFHPMLAPTLLGCSSGALAQSINQYFKRKFYLNKIVKFMIWGCINGYFTVAWINILVTRIDNLPARIIIDQLVGSPSFQLIFNILNTLWDQGELYTSSTGHSFVKSLKYSYCYWPFFSILLFMLIPQSLMFPCNCLANLLWNIILCKIA